MSSTDVEIFRRLGNPEIVDANGIGSNTRQIAAQMRQAIEQAAQCVDEPDGAGSEASAPRRVSKLAEAMRIKEMEAPRVHIPEARALPEPVHAEAPMARDTPVARPAPPEAPRRTPPPPPEAAPHASPDTDSEEEAPAPRSNDPERVRLEKQGYLIELQALQRKGIVLSREFSMRDGLPELEFEVQKQTSTLGTANAVAFMRDTLRMGFTGLEIANTKLGPFLSIDGWAESMTGDMKRFDNALERLHKAYFRKRQVSPIMELAWVIVGSLVAHHFKAKFFGAPAPRPNGGRSEAAPEPRGKPAQPAPRFRAPTAAPLGSRARPTLRPPIALFGM